MSENEVNDLAIDDDFLNFFEFYDNPSLVWEIFEAGSLVSYVDLSVLFSYENIDFKSFVKSQIDYFRNNFLDSSTINSSTRILAKWFVILNRSLAEFLLDVDFELSDKVLDNFLTYFDALLSNPKFSGSFSDLKPKLCIFYFSKWENFILSILNSNIDDFSDVYLKLEKFKLFLPYFLNFEILNNFLKSQPNVDEGFISICVNGDLDQIYFYFLGLVKNIELPSVNILDVDQGWSDIAGSVEDELLAILGINYRPLSVAVEGIDSDDIEIHVDPVDFGIDDLFGEVLLKPFDKPLK